MKAPLGPMATSWAIGELNTNRAVQLEAAGRTFTLRQAPGSGMVGTSLWDSAVALVRHLDREGAGESGALSADRLRQARVIELGAGCGLAGMAFAAYGAHVTFTDKPEVMDHLEANVMQNFGAGGAGTSELRFSPFCWGTDPLVAGLSPPYDVVVATDVIYLQAQIAPLIHSLLALSDQRTAIVIAIERRDESVWLDFQQALKAAFRVRRVSVNRMKSRLGEEEQQAADFLGIFIARKRKRSPPPPKDEAVDAAEAAMVEPPGVAELEALKL